MTVTEARTITEKSLNLEPISTLVNQIALYFKSNNYYINELTFNKEEVSENADGIKQVTITPYYLKRVDFVLSPENKKILFHQMGIEKKDDFFLMEIRKRDYDGGEGHYFDLSVEHVIFPDGKLNNKEKAEFLIKRDTFRSTLLAIRLERTGKGTVTMKGSNKHLEALYQLLS